MLTNSDCDFKEHQAWTAFGKALHGGGVNAAYKRATTELRLNILCGACVWGERAHTSLLTWVHTSYYIVVFLRECGVWLLHYIDSYYFLSVCLLLARGFYLYMVRTEDCRSVEPNSFVSSGTTWSKIIRRHASPHTNLRLEIKSLFWDHQLP